MPDVSSLYPLTEPGRRLRIALALDARRPPEWIRELVRDIQSSEFADLVATLTRPSPEGGEPRDGMSVNGNGFSTGHALYWLYSTLDDRLHPPGPDASAPLDLNGTPSFAIASAPDGKRLDQGLEKQLEDLNLDVILAFEPNVSAAQLAPLATHGVLYPRFGRVDEDRDGPALLWRIYDRAAKAGTDIRLIQQTAQGEPVALESYAATTDSVWLSRHVRVASSKAGTMALRFLRALATGRDVDRKETKPSTRANAGAPSNQQMASFYLRCGGRLARKKIGKVVREVQWLIAFRQDRSRFVAESERADLSGFVPIVPEENHAYADPCVLRREGTDYVFIEDLKRRSARGTIAVLTIDEQGTVGPVRQVLSRGFHLSYPFVFEWEGDAYMLPDTAEANCVQLLKAKNFPFDWELDRELMRGRPMVDSTMHQHEGKWYLFLNAREMRRGSLNDELFLFMAETPLGPWRPHPSNPICSDVRQARPAGRLFLRNGTLIRPSQDCSTRYGSRINLCAVRALSPSHYEEEIIDHIEPGPGSVFDGCHTISFSEGVEVVDVRRTISRFGKAATRIDGGVHPPGFS